MAPETREVLERWAALRTLRSNAAIVGSARLLLRSSVIAIRVDAVCALRGLPEAAAAVRKCADDPAWEVRAAALGAPCLAAEAVGRLRDPDWVVRIHALRVVPAKLAKRHVATLLRDENWQVRRSALAALRKYPRLSKPEREGLLRALGDPHPLVRSQALCTVGELPRQRRADFDEAAREAILSSSSGDLRALQYHLSPRAIWTFSRPLTRRVGKLDLGAITNSASIVKKLHSSS